MPQARWIAVLSLLLVAVAPSVALARRAQTAADVEAPPSGYGASAMTRQPPPHWDAGLTRSELRAALAEVRAPIQQCMTEAQRTGVTRVTARVQLSHVLDVDVRAPDGDAAVTACVELVVRRRLTPLAARILDRAVSATLSVRRRAPRPPRPAHPPHAPPTPAPVGVEAQVHAALDRDRTAMWSCLTAGGADPSGTATLDLTLGADGALALTAAGLPTGVVAGSALGCLSDRITQLRFAPAPASAVAIHHVLAAPPAP